MNQLTKQLKPRQVSKSEKLGYGMGNFSYGLISQMIGFYAVFYATTILGISGKLVGLAVAISVVWDAITDPMMGYISDNTTSKVFGKRHLYLLIGSIGIGVSNYFLWNISPDWTNTIKFLALLFLLLTIKTFITIYTTPYTALGAELSSHYNERTTIQANRTIFFITGIISATALGLVVFFKPTDAYPDGQFNPAAYQNMGLVGAILAVVFGLVCLMSTFKHVQIYDPTYLKTREKFKLSGVFVQMVRTFDNKDYRYVVLGYLFTNIASAILNTIGLHVYTYTFGLNNFQIATIFALQFIVCILSQPVWIVISKRIDKKPTLLLGLIFSIVGSLIMGLLVIYRDAVYGGIISVNLASSMGALQQVATYIKSTLPFVPYAAISGFGVASLLTVPLSMIADTVDLEELKSGTRSEGTYYGVLTFAYKASQAIAIFLLGFLLDLIHFNSDLPIQAENTVIVLGATVTIGSVMAFLTGMFFVNKYSLNIQKVLEVQSLIEKKRK